MGYAIRNDGGGLRAVNSTDDVLDGETYSETVPAPSIDHVRAAQIDAITTACQSAIIGGFSSSALGAAHHYPSQLTDQQNLSASVLASLIPGLPADWTTLFWCADQAGKWSYAEHTIAQIQQVGQDGKAAIVGAIQKKAVLVDKINTAPTVDAVQALIWE